MTLVIGLVAGFAIGVSIGPNTRAMARMFYRAILDRVTS